MKILKRVLYLEAVLWAGKGVTLATFPRFVLVNLAGLRPYPEYAWVRATGITAFSIALLMVLVAQSAEKTWFWTWAFIFGQGGLAALFLVKAAFAVGGSTAFWLASGAFAALMTALLLWGVARAYGERPQESG